MIHKTLSVRQPWAYLICSGIKDIENRTWKLPEKYKGETILIHASAKPNISILESSTIFSNEEWDFLKGFDMMTPFFQHKLATSCIIGSVRFVDCVINHPSIWAEKSQPADFDEYGYPDAYYNKIYNWIVADAVLFDKPILEVKGKLGFWDYDLPEEYVKLLK